MKYVYVKEKDIQEVISSYIYLALIVGLFYLLALLLPSASGLKWFLFGLGGHIIAPFISVDRLMVYEKTDGASLGVTQAPWNCFIWSFFTVLHLISTVFFILTGFIKPLSASMYTFRTERLEYYITIAVWMIVLTAIAFSQALLTYLTSSPSKFVRAKVLSQQQQQTEHTRL